MTQPYILTPEKLKEMADSFVSSSVATEKLERAKKAITRDKEWLRQLSTKLNNK